MINWSDVDAISTTIHVIVPILIEWEKQGNSLEDFLKHYDEGIAIAKKSLAEKEET